MPNDDSMTITLSSHFRTSPGIPPPLLAAPHRPSGRTVDGCSVEQHRHRKFNRLKLLTGLFVDLVYSLLGIWKRARLSSAGGTRGGGATNNSDSRVTPAGYYGFFATTKRRPTLPANGECWTHRRTCTKLRHSLSRSVDWGAPPPTNSRKQEARKFEPNRAPVSIPHQFFPPSLPPHPPLPTSYSPRAAVPAVMLPSVQWPLSAHLSFVATVCFSRHGYPYKTQVSDTATVGCISPRGELRANTWTPHPGSRISVMYFWGCLTTGRREL